MSPVTITWTWDSHCYYPPWNYNIAPDTLGLEDEFPLWKACRAGCYANFWVCNPLDSQPSSHLPGQWFLFNLRHLVSSRLKHWATKSQSTGGNFPASKRGLAALRPSSWTDPTHHAKAGPPEFLETWHQKDFPWTTGQTKNNKPRCYPQQRLGNNASKENLHARLFPNT